MTDFKIAVLPGDGIGPEITEAAAAVCRAAAKKFKFGIHTESALAAASARNAGTADAVQQVTPTLAVLSHTRASENANRPLRDWRRS